MTMAAKDVATKESTNPVKGEKTMKSNAKTVEHLNSALQMEMSAAHQYQLHAHVLED